MMWKNLIDIRRLFPEKNVKASTGNFQMTKIEGDDINNEVYTSLIQLTYCTPELSVMCLLPFFSYLIRITILLHKENATAVEQTNGWFHESAELVRVTKSSSLDNVQKVSPPVQQETTTETN
ncbi:hypothetical protein Y1Q_0003555 [Alligator mississippiensis]|uniref:Uncharacterized protein n=1 Tax=Alligator mississippiensis TaxID=8496 RepID=A0A151M4M1_ALLMI|nr:hypothetical protein Y1Q_0003555 [Alligator mississippiensis]